jgi:hypothetical protein
MNTVMVSSGGDNDRSPANSFNDLGVKYIVTGLGVPYGKIELKQISHLTKKFDTFMQVCYTEADSGNI